MPPRPKFPLELHDLVVDELCDDEGTLRVCLSVSRSFRHRACRYLFESIRIEDAGKDHESKHPEFQEPWTPEEVHSRLELLIALLAPVGDPGSQGILPYIRHVCFGFSTYGLYTVTHEGSSLYPKSAECAVHILDMLSSQSSRLHTIEIDGGGYSDPEGCWSDLIPSIRSSLLHLCRVASTGITLISMSDIPKDILRGTRVSHVFLERVMLYKPVPNVGFHPKISPEYDEKSDMALLPLPILQSAQTDDVFEDFCEFMYPVDVKTSIKALKLSFHLNFGSKKTSERLSREYPNLEVLTVEMNGYDSHSEIDDHFDTRNLVFLKTLTICVDIDGADLTYASALPSLLPSLTSTLLRSCSNTTLSIIDLRLPRLVLDLTSDGSFNIDFNLFSNFDRTMSSPSDCPSLQCLTLHVFTQPTFEPPRDDQKDSKEVKFLDLLQNAFPCLTQSKVAFAIYALFDYDIDA